jgi:hypothetical protein
MGDQYAFYHINQKKCKYFGFSEWEIYYRDFFVVTDFIYYFRKPGVSDLSTEPSGLSRYEY